MKIKCGACNERMKKSETYNSDKITCRSYECKDCNIRIKHILDKKTNVEEIVFWDLNRLKL